MTMTHRTMLQAQELYDLSFKDLRNKKLEKARLDGLHDRNDGATLRDCPYRLEDLKAVWQMSWIRQDERLAMQENNTV